MFGLDNTILGIVIILAGALIIFDYVMRDNEKNDKGKKQEKFRQGIEQNKKVLAILKKYDPDMEFKKKPNRDTIRQGRKLARDLIEHPETEIEELIKRYHLEEESKAKVIQDTMLYLHYEQTRKIKRGGKPSILMSAWLFIYQFLVWIGILFIMWGFALVFL